MAKKRRKDDHCLNCDKELAPEDNYCSNCGQENTHRRVKVKALIADLMRDHWTIDNRSLKSIVPLLFKPGQLTVEYVKGKRVSYNRPLRIYLFISFVLFLCSNAVQFRAASETVDNPDSTATRNINFSLNSDDTTSANVPDSGFARYLYEKQRVLNTPEGQAIMRNALDSNLPIVLFLFIPVLAFLSWLFYFREDYFFADGFVFALHVQSFAFLILTFMLLINLLVQNSLPGLLAYLLILVYYVIAAKRFFEKGWFSTILRFVGVLAAYIFTVGIIFVVYLFVLLAVYI